MTREELIARQGLVMSYVKHVMKPLIGEDLVTEGVGRFMDRSHGYCVCNGFTK